MERKPTCPLTRALQTVYEQQRRAVTGLGTRQAQSHAWTNLACMLTTLISLGIITWGSRLKRRVYEFCRTTNSVYAIVRFREWWWSWRRWARAFGLCPGCTVYSLCPIVFWWVSSYILFSNLYVSICRQHQYHPNFATASGFFFSIFWFPSTLINFLKWG